jgi:uncharacterized protein YjbJ (UPF0337 family)
MMNWDTIEGTWKELSGKAKANWGKITDDEWMTINGRREEIAGLVQRKYGRARDEAEREVDEWFRTL